MNGYNQLAIKYLKMNKRRSIVTILGVVVTVVVLYTILNLGWSRLLMERQMIREEMNYELIFLTENQTQVDQIMSDENVKSAYVGSYYYNDYFEPKTYDNALYINTTNPYRLDSIKNKMEAQYGVASEYNTELVWTYMQGGDANSTVVSILSILLFSFIFAIFGVGIVRNSVQLCTFEQIKDYGNLRCIGAAKGQLKMIVYIQGAILEISGIIIGVVFGYLSILIIGYHLKWEVGFHWIPMLPIIICFLGDLYFAMDESCKVIINLTPVSAIRGEYRIRKEKIKLRKKNIFGRIWGIEGDYAYKSIMRNPGRFVKTVAALGIGIGAYMAVATSISAANDLIKEERERYQYYNVYFQNTLGVNETPSEVQTSLPPTEVFQRITDLEETIEAKRMYATEIAVKDWKEVSGHFTDEYFSQTATGPSFERIINILESGEEVGYSIKTLLEDVTCFGYEKADIERYKEVLVDGTVDISENGIILVNGGSVPVVSDDDYGMVQCYRDVTYTDYKVGDTVEILDMEQFRSMAMDELEAINKEYEEKESEILATKTDENWIDIDRQLSELSGEKTTAKNEVVERCKKKLRDEKAYKTYTIEGIVSEDVNHRDSYYDEIAFILPLEQYYEMTATDESVMTGMQYHFEDFSVKSFEQACSSGNTDWFDEELNEYSGSGFIMSMVILDSVKKIGKWVILIVVFVVTMTSFNIINTTASNLHLRRKEFAQLRVIGISKEGLMKMVMLEGVISSVVANILGIAIGIILSKASVGMFLSILFAYEYKFPFVPAIIGILVSTLILCGSIYVPLQGLKQNMAEDLATGGD